MSSSAAAAGGCIGGGTGGRGRIRVDYETLNGTVYPDGAATTTNPAAYFGLGE